MRVNDMNMKCDVVFPLCFQARMSDESQLAPHPKLMFELLITIKRSMLFDFFVLLFLMLLGGKTEWENGVKLRYKMK